MKQSDEKFHDCGPYARWTSRSKKGKGRRSGEMDERPEKSAKIRDAVDSLFDGWRLRGNIFSGIRARGRALEERSEGEDKEEEVEDSKR